MKTYELERCWYCGKHFRVGVWFKRHYRACKVRKQALAAAKETR